MPNLQASGTHHRADRNNNTGKRDPCCDPCHFTNFPRPLAFINLRIGAFLESSMSILTHDMSILTHDMSILTHDMSILTHEPIDSENA